MHAFGTNVLLGRSINPSNVCGYSRGAALRTILAATTLAMVTPFLQHRNPHVVKVADREATQRFGFGLVPLKTHAPEPTIAASEPVIPAIDFSAIGSDYGFDAAFTENLYHEKGDDLAALRRSLAARKAAKARNKQNPNA